MYGLLSYQRELKKNKTKYLIKTDVHQGVTKYLNAGTLISKINTKFSILIIK